MTTQKVDTIEVNEQEAAAIAAHVQRLRASGEPDLTAAALLARMTHKVVRGWADQIAADATTQQLQLIETKLRDVPAGQRSAVLAQLVDTIEAAVPVADDEG